MAIVLVPLGRRHLENNFAKNMWAIDIGWRGNTWQVDWAFEKRRYIRHGSTKGRDAESAQNGQWNDWIVKQDANRIVSITGS